MTTPFDQHNTFLRTDTEENQHLVTFFGKDEIGICSVPIGGGNASREKVIRFDDEPLVNHMVLECEEKDFETYIMIGKNSDQRVFDCVTNTMHNLSGSKLSVDNARCLKLNDSSLLRTYILIFTICL